MRRSGIVVAGIVVFVVVASQLVVPSLAEDRVEDRLTENGGTAEVELGAVPALRLLFGDGERFEVEAAGLDLALDERTEVFDRLDGFSIVDVAISDFIAGPFEIERFELEREDSETYRLASDGTTTPGELAQYGAEALEVPGGGFADFLLDQLFDDSDVEIPFALDMELASDDGRVQVVGGDGEVAGIPTGPLAQLITAAIVVRL
jgi:hypothetical protein